MRLEDICTVFTDGDWIESKDQSDEGIRLVQTGNIGKGIYLEKEARAKYISEDTFEKLKCTEIFPGDILVSRLPEPVGRACIIPDKEERMITAVDCTICRPDETVISKEYLCYFMRSNAYYTRLLGSVTGTTRKRISRKNLGNVELDVPSREKQNEVVEQLDHLVNVIDSKTRELQLLDDLIQARFVEMFGDLMINNKQWMRLKISEICTEIVDCINKTAPTVEYETEYKMLRTTNVKNGEVDISDVKYVEQKVFDKWTRRSTPQNGDVLLTREAPMGQVGLLHGVKNDVFLGQRLVSYRCDSTKMDPIFLTYQMMSGYFQDQIKKTGKGSTVKHIPVPNCTEFEVFVPPIVKQKEFATFVHQINKIETCNLPTNHFCSLILKL